MTDTAVATTQGADAVQRSPLTSLPRRSAE